jgi:hypothetical protein
MTNGSVYIMLNIRNRRGDKTMELLIQQCEHNQSEEPCEKSTPKKEVEEKDSLEYDYNKRLWF